MVCVSPLEDRLYHLSSTGTHQVPEDGLVRHTAEKSRSFSDLGFPHKVIQEPIILDNTPYWDQEAPLRGTVQLVDDIPKCGYVTDKKESNIRGENGLDNSPGSYLLCQEDTSDWSFIFVTSLKACTYQRDLDNGATLHADIVKTGYLESSIFVTSALVNMYAKCGALDEAQVVFDRLHVCNVVTWNALIAGYAQHEHGQRALSCFQEMQIQGFRPDTVTLACIFKACGSIGSLTKGQEAHTHLVKAGLLGENIHADTALVDMYAKCGALDKAGQIFSELSVRNKVSWNTLMTAYVQQGQWDRAFSCLEKMQYERHFPDAYTFSCILKACSRLGTAYKGQELHAQVVKRGELETGLFVGTALVDMYANCGMVAQAHCLFDLLLVRDAASWGAIIAGYGQLGKDEMVFILFHKMIREHMEPDPPTVSIILNTCSHSGLLKKGELHLDYIFRGSGLLPTLEHLACMVDLFGRAGQLEVAVAIIVEMPMLANLALWHALLSSCRMCRDMNLGEWAFDCAVQLGQKHSSAYACMRNMYADTGMLEDEGE